MKITETTLTALIALSTNKVRSALTMLGVIIGVAAVIMLIALGEGVQNYITDEFESLGSDLIFVSPGKVNFGRDPNESITRNKLNEEHVELIEKYASDYIVDVTPYIQLGDNVEYKTKSFYSSVLGVNENANNILNFDMEEGSFINRSQVRTSNKVAIIGKIVNEELFTTDNPLDKRIKIGSDSYTVVGVLKEKGRNYDESIIIPYTSAMDTFELNNYSSIVAKAEDGADSDTAMKKIQTALLRDLDEDDFSVLSQEDLLGSIQEILRILTLALGAIAGISLVVGGIGIMNIMLVSVTERTREIGLRKALGATPNDISLQFLIESTLLSITGGGIGLLLGWMGSLGARGFVRTEVPWWAVLLAFSFAAFVGIIFGTYPAIKAGKKDPIEALRYE